MESIKGRIRVLADPGLALGAGLLAASAFPPVGITIAAAIGICIMSRSLANRATFASGWLFGVGLLAPQLSWLANFQALAPWPVVMLSAVPYGVAARFGGTPLRFAAAMTAAEVFRSMGVLAFPWGLAGSLLGDTDAARLAAWVGGSGLSFLFFFACAFAGRGLRSAAAVFLSVLIGIPACAWLPSPAGGQRVTVGVVQAAILPEGDYEYRPDGVMNAMIRGTESLAARGAQVIVWSETVILEYLNRPSRARERIAELARRLDVMIVCGAPTIITDADKRNSAYVFTPGAVGNVSGPGPSMRRYDKVHLVPFGEFLPGKGPDIEHALLPEGVGDFSPAPTVFAVGRLGPLICYEGVLPEVARRTVLAGADLVVNLSNDAWARSTQEAHQHHGLTLLRAAELGRPFVRAGNVGPSGIVGANGRTLAESSSRGAAVILAEVEIPEGTTLFVRWGDWVGWLALWGLPFSLTVATLVAEDRGAYG